MRPLEPPRSAASPAYGVLRGMRAGVLALLCVLLPLAGHVLSRGHTPRWAVVMAMALVAVPGAAVLTRRRLTDTQLLVALAVAQLAYHAAYALPGACAAVAAQGGRPGGPTWLIEHDAVAGPPPGVLLAGHLVTLLLASRLLGITERLLWQGRPLLAAVRRLLLFVWPLLGRSHGTGPQTTVRENAPRLRSTVLVRLYGGRAPPRGAVSPLALSRPLPIGGPRLP
ncbi:hypothetical protein IM697_24725 [Streptomyces ferrugineus]|uniref:Uncharacterized protein n=1 Tax=Streptomyces ferrugineus TaxID=1413221 RepID=A0A7M2SAL4_9ACTN|nr:hypothetical protein [Streptomyces ferrugineus]QOV33417.1 hypothetical protein IM697_24725 [Streptomyces ferrugineus]